MANVLKQINFTAPGGLCTRLQLIYKAVIGVGGGPSWRRPPCGCTPWPRL